MEQRGKIFLRRFNADEIKRKVHEPHMNVIAFPAFLPESIRGKFGSDLSLSQLKCRDGNLAQNKWLCSALRTGYTPEHVDMETGEPTEEYWKWRDTSYRLPNLMRDASGDASLVLRGYVTENRQILQNRWFIYLPLMMEAISIAKSFTSALDAIQTQANHHILLMTEDVWTDKTIELTRDVVQKYLSQAHGQLCHAVVVGTMLLEKEKEWLNF